MTVTSDAGGLEVHTLFRRRRPYPVIGDGHRDEHVEGDRGLTRDGDAESPFVEMDACAGGGGDGAVLPDEFDAVDLPPRMCADADAGGAGIEAGVRHPLFRDDLGEHTNSAVGRVERLDGRRCPVQQLAGEFRCDRVRGREHMRCGQLRDRR
jgi:hypothetical protein